MGLFDGLFRRARAQRGRDDAASAVSESPAAVAQRRMIGGRLRAAGVPYALPADDEEINRLDFQHFVLRQAFKGNYAAPIQHPRSILDVGTGTGRWARETAAYFPDANVIGTDINTPRIDEIAERGGPELRPPNYTFVPANVLDGLPFRTGDFDFTHMRLLTTGMPANRWQDTVNELVRVTAPDGWVESVEATIPYNGGAAWDQLFRWIAEVQGARGVDLQIASQVHLMMQRAGLANVRTRTINLPIGRYGGRGGSMLALDYFTGIKGVGGLLVTQGKVSQREFDAILAQAQADVDSSRYRCVAPFHIAYGQRLLSAPGQA